MEGIFQHDLAATEILTSPGLHLQNKGHRCLLDIIQNGTFRLSVQLVGGPVSENTSRDHEDECPRTEHDPCPRPQCPLRKAEIACTYVTEQNEHPKVSSYGCYENEKPNGLYGGPSRRKEQYGS